MSDRLRNVITWGLIGVFAVFNALKPFIPGTPLEAALPAVSILSMLGFVLLHGPVHIGMRRLGVFFVIAFMISWSYESLSIATGFPFGNYYYTDKMGPKLGTVPLLIMPAYFAANYISWYLAKVLLDRFDESRDVVQTYVVPVVAAFVMSMWDLSMDPSRSTYSKSWIWEDGGAYFGVPFKNFLGWLLCVWTIFQVYALYQKFTGASGGQAGTASDTKMRWWQILGLYVALAVEFPSYAIFAPSGSVTDATGVTWQLSHLYETQGLVAIFTMFFVILLASYKLATTKAIPRR